MSPSRAGWIVLALVACTDTQARTSPRADDEGVATDWTTVGERIPYAFAVPIATGDRLPLGGASVGIRASDCGACHTSIYEEWRRSTHARAMRDPQYYAELSKPAAPRWLCLSCHAPVQKQRRWRITADTRLVDDPQDVSQLERVPNPSYDRTMQLEGVTCATCHVRADGDESYVVAARPSGRAPHPVRAEPSALRNVCLRCHDPGRGHITPVFQCWFETAQEGRQHGVKKACIDCHMPAVTRAVAPGAPARPNRHHYWTGGGVPKRFGGYDDLLARAYTPGASLDARVDGATLTISLANDAAGHHVTSADPERFIWVRTVVDGRVLDTKRVGQTWDWGQLGPDPRLAQRIADNRLPAGGSMSWTVDVPPEARRIVVSAAHVRVVPANARHMKGARIPAELTAIWPAAAERVAHLEQHYPMMTWFARVATEDRRTWVRTPIAELLAESKALRGTALETYEAILAPAPAR